MLCQVYSQYMRAALWSGGENIQNPQFIQHLKECDIIVAADQGLTNLQLWNIQPTLWVGDGDSYQGNLADGCKSILLPRNKDLTDTECAIQELIKLGVTEIWLFCGAGRRTDHWLSNLNLVSSQLLISRWYTAFEEIFFVTPKDELKVQGKTISIFPVGNPPWQIRAEGLRWPIEAIDFLQWYSLSNEIIDGFCRIQPTKGRFMIILPGEGY